jgi:citronellol/citronellal dehydrogenase
VGVNDTGQGYRSVLRPGLYDGHVVVVTGGGSGIGRCIAHELASLGAQVVVMGRTAAKLERVADEIATDADAGACDWTTCDIRDPEQVADAVRVVVDRHGRVDGLVNNAGGQFPAPLEQISPRGFDAVIRNNLLGTFHMMREVFEAWMGEHGGAIVNITAEHRSGFPGMGHTGAARAGVANLTMTAATEWGRAGVRVNEVAPGLVASSGLDTYEEPLRSLIRTYPGNIPLGRMANEAEVSAAVCFLLSPAAAAITGTCLRVDGGTLGAHREWPLWSHDTVPFFDGFHRAELPTVFDEEG